MSAHHHENTAPEPQDRHGAWLESIALMGLLRDGNQPAAKNLLNSTTDKDCMVGDILSLFSMFLRMQDRINPNEVESFVEASLRVGPPPLFGNRPYLA